MIRVPRLLQVSNRVREAIISHGFVQVFSKKRYNIYSVLAFEMSAEKQGLFIYPSPGNKIFRDRVKELSGEKVELCFQCGACSSGCPMTQEMDYLPSKVIRMVQLGLEEALDSKTIWVCTTCFNCEVRCPRGIDIANVMESLRQLVLRRKYDRVTLDQLSDDQLRELPQVAIISCLRKLTA
jgi:heterodisulfide reductase subunit C